MKNPTTIILPIITIIGLLSLSLFSKQSIDAAQNDYSLQKHAVPATPSYRADYLSAMEREVLDEINVARTNPLKYAEFAKDLRNSMAGRMIKRPGKPTILSQEGIAAVDETIGFLSSVRFVTALSPSRGLSMAAQNLARNQGPKGTIGHEGPDGSQVNHRADRYGEWTALIGENINYGAETPRELVLALIIDDGVPSRGHRKNIFNPMFRMIGIACGPHAKFSSMCVMDFAGGYKEK